MSIHVGPRPIILCRAGDTEATTNTLESLLANLSEDGRIYKHNLSLWMNRFLLRNEVSNDPTITKCVTF